MRWKIEIPKAGDERFVPRFAWFPTIVANADCSSTWTVWLEEYQERQYYKGISLGWAIIGRYLAR